MQIHAIHLNNICESGARLCSLLYKCADAVVDPSHFSTLDYDIIKTWTSLIGILNDQSTPSHGDTLYAALSLNVRLYALM